MSRKLFFVNFRLEQLFSPFFHTKREYDQLNNYGIKIPSFGDLGNSGGGGDFEEIGV